MSTIENRELTITDPESGSSVTFVREGSVVKIQSAFFAERHVERKVPLVLSAADRRTLIDFLNMGEYRQLTYGEAR